MLVLKLHSASSVIQFQNMVQFCYARQIFFFVDITKISILRVVWVDKEGIQVYEVWL